jgi:hypothetical protein
VKEEKQNTEKNEISSLSDNQLNNIIFGTLYKRKISIKDWLYTKAGFLVLVVSVYLFFTDSLNGQNIAIILAFSLWLYNKEKTLAHEKEKSVWLLKYKKMIFQRLEEIEKKKIEKMSKFTEAEEILEACHKNKQQKKSTHV